MPSHVVPNIVLEPEKWQQDILETRFHMAKQVYNRTLDAWLKRRRAYLNSDLFKSATFCEDEDKRKKLFGEAMAEYGFGEYEISNESISANDKNKFFGKPSGDGWCSDMAYHLPSEVLRRIGGMAAQAVHMYHTEQGWGKPTPKSEPPPLVACGKTIRLEEDACEVRIGGPRGGADTMRVQVNEDYLQNEKVERSLADRKVYSKVMICRTETISGEPMYKAKVTCNGHAPISADTVVNEGVVGVDVGPSMVAAVGPDDAWMGPILDCSFIDDYANVLRRLARKSDRQRRANNPDHFDSLGRVIKSGDWDISNRQVETEDAKRDIYRKMVEERKRQHYELCKKLLSMGNEFVVEDNSYSGWQSGLFGSSVGDFAPSAFIDRLEEKAEAAGGGLTRISTWDTYLSSRCHCGRETSKDLSDRWHECKCGVSSQRDLYSAYLARYTESGELDADQARKDWSKLEPALQSASSKCLSREV